MMNDLSAFSSFENTITTLQEASKDDGSKPVTYMTNSQHKVLDFDKINNPDAEHRGCCSHKVVTVGFNTLITTQSVGVLNPPHE